jgi:hypothetical protein
METRGRALTLAILASLVCAASAVAAPSYVGATKCRACHLKQFTSWQRTRMALSFDLLKPGVKSAEKKAAGLNPTVDYTTDATCLPCHTTGYLQPGGFVSVKATPNLVGIQCESCHGPGSDYLAKGKMTIDNKEYKRAELVAASLVVPRAETCTTICHNDKSPFVKAGYVFDFEARKTAGTHEHVALKYPH